MTLREAMQALYDRHGYLSPQIVVEEAANGKDAVGAFLHSRLTWDNDEAAERWRLEEAQRLIRRVRVVIRPTPASRPYSIRAFHSVPTPRGRVYKPTEEIAADPLLSRMLLQEAERAWRDLKARYGHLAQFIALIRQDLDDDEAA